MKASNFIGVQLKHWRFYKTQFTVQTKRKSTLISTHTLKQAPFDCSTHQKKSTCGHEWKAEATTGTNTDTDVETACLAICTVTAALHNPLVFESNTPPSPQQAMFIKSLKKTPLYHNLSFQWKANVSLNKRKTWPSCCDGM